MKLAAVFNKEALKNYIKSQCFSDILNPEPIDIYFNEEGEVEVCFDFEYKDGDRMMPGRDAMVIPAWRINDLLVE